MSTYHIGEYAGALTKDDVIDLFEILKESYSISEAARLCELKRKTIYDWEEVDYIKLKTKKKVLNTVINFQPEKTLEFLLKRFEENTADILYIYFTFIYEKAIVKESHKEVFKKFFDRFNEIKQEYSGLIHKRLGEEIGDLSQVFKETAINLGIPVPPLSLNEIKSTDIVEILPDVMRDLFSERYRGLTTSSIAKELNLPSELIDALFDISTELKTSVIRWHVRKTPLAFTSSEEFFGYEMARNAFWSFFIERCPKSKELSESYECRNALEMASKLDFERFSESFQNKWSCSIPENYERGQESSATYIF